MKLCAFPGVRVGARSRSRRLGCCARLILAYAICGWGASTFAQAETLAVYTARVESEAVELRGFIGDREVRVAEELRRSRWHPFGLRGLSPNLPAVADSVREVVGDLPRLQVRDDYQIVAFSEADGWDDDDESDETIRGGLAALGPWGARVFLEGRGRPYRPVLGGAFVSPDGQSMLVMLDGARRQEVFLLGLGEFPTVRRVRPPREVGRILPRSLGLIEGALFFVARQGEDSVLCRAPVDTRHGPLRAEVVSDAFPMICTEMAYSPVAIAYMAGEESEAVYESDVFVAGATGRPLNLTRFPAHYVENEPGVERLAISPDGRAVAYSLKEYDLEAETFLHTVDEPGVAGRRHITSDELFAPYIEQDIFLYFRSSDQLVLSAGHTDETDFYLVSGGSTLNLTGTGTSLQSATLASLGAGTEILSSTAVSSQAPFQVGTLSPRRAVSTPSGLILIAADGFAGQPGLVGASAETGATVFKELGLDELGDFFEFDGDTYFVGLTSGSGFELFRETGTALERVGEGPTDERPRLLAHGPERSFVDLPGRGLLALHSGHEPSLIVTGDLEGTIALSPCGERLVLSRDGEYFVLDLESLAETPLVGVPPFSGEVVAFRAAFPRGDVDGDDRVTGGDALSLLSHLFEGTTLLSRGAADANDDGRVNLRDVDVIVHQLWRHHSWRGPPRSSRSCEE